jgi:hypothetical protein
MSFRPLPSALLLSLFLALGAFASGCGSQDPSKKDDSSTAGAAGASNADLPTGPLYPWTVGNNWTYKVTDEGVETIKTTTIEKADRVGGAGPYADADAYHVVTAKGEDLKDRTESWQTPDPDNAERIVRYREQSFSASTGELELEEYWDPAKLHIDGSAEHTVKGVSWLEAYSETKLPVGLTPVTHDVRERWTVVDDDETVTLPLATFEHAIHFQKVGGSLKDYWYLRGVGKLKETGGQTEELTDYALSAEAAP